VIVPFDLIEAGTSFSTAALAAGVAIVLDGVLDGEDEVEVEVANPDGGVFAALVDDELLLPHPASAMAPITGTNTFHVRI
jgi:hypothetical protein